MFILYFLFWILLNGRITVEIAVFGVVIAAALYLFTCLFLDYSFKKDIALFRRIPLVFVYCALLIREIVKANLAMLPFIFSPNLIPEPALVRFDPGLKTHLAQMILANSITLTPGTITVDLVDGEYMVHCFDKEMGLGIESSVFVQILRKMEALGL